MKEKEKKERAEKRTSAAIGVCLVLFILSGDVENGRV